MAAQNLETRKGKCFPFTEPFFFKIVRNYFTIIMIDNVVKEGLLMVKKNWVTERRVRG